MTIPRPCRTRARMEHIIEGWILSQRRNRFDQKLVEKLVHSHTKLVMRETLDTAPATRAFLETMETLVATNQQWMLAWRVLVELIVRCVTRTCTRAFALCRVMSRWTTVGTVGVGARTGSVSVMMGGRDLAAAQSGEGACMEGFGGADCQVCDEDVYSGI